MKRLAALLAASLLLAGCTAAGSGGMRASRPTDARWVAVVRFRGSFRKVCRGGIYCARRRVSEANRRTAAALRPEIPPGALRRRRVPGTMQASSPTEVCYNAGPQFPGWPRHSPSSVGADSISARGCLPRRRVRRDGGIPPYGRPEGGGRPCLAPNTKFIRRGGIYPARGRSRRRGVRRDGGIPPYGRPGGLRLSGFAGHFGRFVGAGFIPPGALRRRRVPGTMQASSPTEVCYNAGPRFLGWPRHSPSSVGADSISARGCLRRRGVRRDEGIPPYGRPEGGGRPCLARNANFIRRGGFHIRPGPCGDAGFPGRSPA